MYVCACARACVLKASRAAAESMHLVRLVFRCGPQRESLGKERHLCPPWSLPGAQERKARRCSLLASVGAAGDGAG